MDLSAGTDIRNEFAVVHVAVRPFGRGRRLEVSSGRLRTTAQLDATVLEALSSLDPHYLAELVGVAMLQSDRTVDAAPAADLSAGQQQGPAHTGDEVHNP